MIWCVLDSDERQHANHNVEHGAAACPHTDSNCNHNVELVFTNSLFLDTNKNHNVEHGAAACPRMHDSCNHIVAQIF